MTALPAIVAGAALVAALAACAPPPPEPVPFPLAPLERAAQCVAQLVTGTDPTPFPVGDPPLSDAERDARGYWSCPPWALDETREAIEAAGITDPAAWAAAHTSTVRLDRDQTDALRAAGRSPTYYDIATSTIVLGADGFAPFGDGASFYEAHETIGHPIATALGLIFGPLPEAL